MYLCIGIRADWTTRVREHLSAAVLIACWRIVAAVAGGDNSVPTG